MQNFPEIFTVMPTQNVTLNTAFLGKNRKGELMARFGLL